MLMEFLKSRYEYKTIFSKEDAIKELKKDNRIKNIIATKRQLLILTHPIVPDSQDITFLFPIGIFKIKIFLKYDSDIHEDVLHCDINRVGGGITTQGIHTLHIQTGFNDKICWGNMDSTIPTICENKDWFWLAKKCLDIIEDGEIYEEPLDHASWLYSLQIKFAYENDEKYRKRKIKILREKIDDLCDEAEDNLSYASKTLKYPKYRKLKQREKNGIKNKR